MTNRPTASPALLADIAGKLPSRVAKRLDAEPTLAESWTWAESGGVWTVTSTETVTLRPKDGGLDALSDIICSCLLAPRCLHIAAVVQRLPIAEAASTTAVVESPPAEIVTLTPSQEQAARGANEALADALAAGIDALGALRQGQLLRALHEARAAGLHRLGRALLRVVELGRDLREGVPELALDDLVQATLDGLASAHALLTSPSLEWLGTARRDFEPITGRVLYGLFVEPIISATGYAGAVTWLADPDGRLFSVGNVMPGPPDRALMAYGSGLGLGQIGTPMSDIARSGVFLGQGRAAPDGRLGGGQDVRATPASARSSWFSGPLAQLWGTPLTTQLAMDRPFVFVDVRLGAVGSEGIDAAIIGDAEREIGVALIADSDHRALAYADNLRVLARGAGHVVRGIFRVLPRRPRVLAPLALASDSTVIHWPEAWHRRASLGFDRLSPSFFSPPEAHEPTAPPTLLRPPPLDALRRRVARVVLGGRATLPEGLAALIGREARALDATFLPTAAQLLRELHAAALVHTRTFAGERRAARPDVFAHAWLRAATYLHAAERSAALAQWRA